jgi:hypothetical protein
MPRNQSSSRKTEIRKQIRERMQEEFRNFYKYGRRARTGEVVALIRSDFPDLVQEISDDLTNRALQDMAADVAGTWASVAEKGERQLVLPGMKKDLLERLPPALSIPVEGNVKDIDFVPAQTATLVEWQTHLDYLLQQYKGLGMAIEAIREVIERGTAADCPSDQALLPWLSQKASAASTAK